MTNDLFLDYLQSVIRDENIKYYNSSVDFTKEKSITVYSRTGTAPLNTNDIRILPITIIIIFGKNADVAQKFVNNLFYNHLFRKEKQTINNNEFLVIGNNLPVFLGKTEEGFFEYSIDINIYY